MYSPQNINGTMKQKHNCIPYQLGGGYLELLQPHPTELDLSDPLQR